MTKRFILPNGQEADIRAALECAKELRSSDAIEEIIFLLPTKQHLAATTFATAVGATNAELLAKGPISAGSLRFRLETERTFGHVRTQAVVVAVYADKKMMDKVDGERTLLAVIAIPHMAGALDAWKKAWSPIVVGAVASKLAVSQIKDSVVEEAMKDLTGSINLGTGLSSTRDKEYAVEVLRTLRYLSHHAEDPADIRAWAVANGWKPQHADGLEKLATKAFGTSGKPKGLAADRIAFLKTRWGA